MASKHVDRPQHGASRTLPWHVGRLWTSNPTKLSHPSPNVNDTPDKVPTLNRCCHETVHWDPQHSIFTSKGLWAGFVTNLYSSFSLIKGAGHGVALRSNLAGCLFRGTHPLKLQNHVHGGLNQAAITRAALDSSDSGSSQRATAIVANHELVGSYSESMNNTYDPPSGSPYFQDIRQYHDNAVPYSDQANSRTGQFASSPSKVHSPLHPISSPSLSTDTEWSSFSIPWGSGSPDITATSPKPDFSMSSQLDSETNPARKCIDYKWLQ
jgi:hypothetical protein